jgi:hypothetical protein
MLCNNSLSSALLVLLHFFQIFILKPNCILLIVYQIELVSILSSKQISQENINATYRFGVLKETKYFLCKVISLFLTSPSSVTPTDEQCGTDALEMTSVLLIKKVKIAKSSARNIAVMSPVLWRPIH